MEPGAESLEMHTSQNFEVPELTAPLSPGLGIGQPEEKLLFRRVGPRVQGPTQKSIFRTGTDGNAGPNSCLAPPLMAWGEMASAWILSTSRKEG